MSDSGLLSSGGALGAGEQFALVPSEALTLEHGKDVLVLLCTKAGLETVALPGGKSPPLDNEAWLTRCRDLCTKARAASVITGGDVIVLDGSSVAPGPFADAYDLKHLETVKGTITTIGSVRVGDQKEERVRLRVRLADGREVIVHAAPAGWKIQQALGMRPGKLVEVTGSPARCGTQTVLVAGAIAVDHKTARLRDDQGRATWVRQ